MTIKNNYYTRIVFQIIEMLFSLPPSSVSQNIAIVVKIHPSNNLETPSLRSPLVIKL